MRGRLLVSLLVGAPVLILLVSCTAWPRALTPSPAPIAAPGPNPLPTATQPPSLTEVELPFETIERGESSDYYELHPLEPQRMMLVGSAQEAARLANMVSPQTQKKLAQVDYGTHFVIALFRGHFASSGYDVVIQRVVRQGARLAVHVQFWAPSPYYAVTAASSDPYHAIKVRRDGGPLQEEDLVLEIQKLTPTPPASIRRLSPTAPRQ